jgi:hypothetical protein
MIEVHHEPPEIVAEFGRVTEKCYFCPAPTRYWDRSKKFSVCPSCAQLHDDTDLKRERKMKESMKPGSWGSKGGKPAITWWRHGQAAKGEAPIVTEVRKYATEAERFDAYQNTEQAQA